MVQWLRLGASTAEASGLVPGHTSRMPRGMVKKKSFIFKKPDYLRARWRELAGIGVFVLELLD